MSSIARCLLSVSDDAASAGVTLRQLASVRLTRREAEAWQHPLLMSESPRKGLPPSCPLTSAVVEVVELDIGRAAGAERTSWLSAAERERADRFAFERDRSRYVCARASLRQVLGACLGVHPARVTLVQGPHGKPALAAAHRPLGFNLSHSGDRALVAVALGREVGVDLEQIRADIDLLGIARSYFTQGEARELASTPAPEQPAAFFRLWTAKESYLKARGEGLTTPLDGFELEDQGPRPFTLRWSRLDPPGSVWRIVPLDLGAGWTAALTCEGTEWSVRRWRGIAPGAQCHGELHA